MNCIKLHFTHPTFNSSQVVIVRIPYCVSGSHRDYAIDKACKHFNVNKKEITIFDCRSIGEAVIIM